MVVGLATPALTFAQSPNGNGKGQSCETFVARLAAFETKLNDRKDKLDAHRLDRLSKFNAKQANRTERFEDKRERKDENLEARIARLNGRATTNEQKAAVTAFQKAVAQALADRREVVDAAIAAFRTGVDKAINDHKKATDTTVDARVAAIKAAIAKAKTDCANGVSQETVRENFHAALKAAQEQFKTDRQGIEKVKVQIQVLIETRKAAFAKAQGDFKKALEAAKEDLKQAFDED